MSTSKPFSLLTTILLALAITSSAFAAGPKPPVKCAAPLVRDVRSNTCRKVSFADKTVRWAGWKLASPTCRSSIEMFGQDYCMGK